MNQKKLLAEFYRKQKTLDKKVSRARTSYRKALLELKIHNNKCEVTYDDNGKHVRIIDENNTKED